MVGFLLFFQFKFYNFFKVIKLALVLFSMWGERKKEEEKDGNL